MLCQECNEDTVATVAAKCSDLCHWQFSPENQDEIIKDGYVPTGLGIGEGDYIEFSYCMSCKRIQDHNNTFPINLENLRDGA